MATVRFRYKNGETDEWVLSEQVSGDELGRTLGSALTHGRLVGFPTTSSHGETPSDYGFVGIRMSEVVSWHIDGLVDTESLIGPWSEADGSAEDA